MFLTCILLLLLLLLRLSPLTPDFPLSFSLLLSLFSFCHSCSFFCSWDFAASSSAAAVAASTTLPSAFPHLLTLLLQTFGFLPYLQMSRRL
jgi:hypothetical protein